MESNEQQLVHRPKGFWWLGKNDCFSIFPKKNGIESLNCKQLRFLSKTFEITFLSKTFFSESFYFFEMSSWLLTDMVRHFPILERQKYRNKKRKMKRERERDEKIAKKWRKQRAQKQNLANKNACLSKLDISVQMFFAIWDWLVNSFIFLFK